MVSDFIDAPLTETEEKNIIRAMMRQKDKLFVVGDSYGCPNSYTLLERTPLSQIKQISANQASYLNYENINFGDLFSSAGKKKKTEIIKTEIIPQKKRKIPRNKVYSNLEFDRPNPQDKIVLLSLQPTHTDTSMNIETDRQTVSNERGYRTCKTTHGTSHGTFYYEAEVINDTGCCRIGWSQILGEPHGPVGYDEYSYSIRSKDCSTFHVSRASKYSDTSFSKGDTLGCKIHLPPYSDSHDALHIASEIAAKYPKLKEGTYMVDMDILIGSYIEFYVNGIPLGRAFTHLYKAKYYPAVSLYAGCKVRLNFGPEFKYPVEGVEPFSNVVDLNE